VLNKGSLSQRRTSIFNIVNFETETGSGLPSRITQKVKNQRLEKALVQIQPETRALKSKRIQMIIRQTYQ
jgi:hypothetical protein